MLSAKEVAVAAVKALDSKKGENLKLIEITDVSTLADYFLICTATSSTHVKTLCDAVEEAMDKLSEPLLSREGHRGGAWVLMDYGSVVVHVFTQEARKFYDLERLWQDGRQLNLSGITETEKID
jgi:ribosome-associated protein